MNRLIESDLKKFNGLVLKNIKGFGQICYDDGGVGFENILFNFDELNLHLRVNEDTDEIVLDFNHGCNHHEWVEVSSLQKFSGQKMSWIWVSKNTQGYQDSVIFSFGRPIPQLMLLSMASIISIYKIMPDHDGG